MFSPEVAEKRRDRSWFSKAPTAMRYLCWGQQDASTTDAALRMIGNQVTQVIHEGGIGDGDNANN